MFRDMGKLIALFVMLAILASCRSVPAKIIAPETTVSPTASDESSPPILLEQTETTPSQTDNPATEESAADEEVQAGRTVNGRILNYDGQPIPGLPLQLEPGGDFVTETIGDGRFTLNNLPFQEITVYASHLQFTIPAGDAPELDLGDIDYPLVHPPVLPLADYPPSSTPYRIETGAFWLVHTPEGQLFAFSPVVPEYRDSVAVEECQFAWSETVMRFVDPCSGDEWELNGRLNLEHSSELWSNRSLDQYYLSVLDEQIFIQFDHLYRGLPVNELPLAADSQFGVTMTVAVVDFSPSATMLRTVTQVDPVWQMNPTAFPPQQALTYPTFPDSLLDDQGQSVPSASSHGGLAVFDPDTGGLRQEAQIYWDGIVPDAHTVTATLTTDLSELYREVVLPIAWDEHEAGETWEEDIPLEIGYAVAWVRQVEWINMTPDGRMRLRLTVVDDSPEELNLYCLHLDTEDPWQRTCANFEGEKEYIIIAPADEPLTLHLRAGVELLRPFQFVLNVDSIEVAAWQPYENAELGLAFHYPAEWTLTGRENGLTLTAPQIVDIGSDTVPWTIWVSLHEKFAEDASLFEVIVNQYHFQGVIENFEDTLTEETINGQTAYRSTILPGAPGGQLSVFFEDGDRFVEVMLRPFDEERPYPNQEAFAQLFATLLQSVTFIED